MLSCSRALSILVALACGPFLLATANQAHAFQCEKQIMKALEEVNMGKADVKTMKVMKYPQFSGFKQSSVYTWDAWITTDACEGHVNVHLTKSCMVMDVYTTDGCQMTGMKEFW